MSTTKLNSTGMLLESTQFSSGHSTDSNSPTDDSELHTVFRWVLSKKRNHQSETDDTPSPGLLEHSFHQINFHNEKGWSTQLRLTNHLYIVFICVHLADHLEVVLLRNHLG